MFCPAFRARALRLLALALIAALPVAAALPARAAETTGAAGSPDFAREVAPIFAARCIECHGAAKQKGGLRLDLKAAAMKGGDSGAAIIPGQSAASPLLRNVLRAPDATPMPPQGAPLAEAQIEILRRWIDAGAEWPEGASVGAAHAPPAAAHPAKTDFWSFQPIKRPEIPEPKKVNSAAAPIDRFIRARLEKENLSPSPEADRRTLIRRLSFDLTGLPPSPQDAAAFLADARPDAYERLVDRLLASPRYGERWGRHWLDVARFGETHGFDKDKKRDRAWPYRDYVIRAFNEDKPYGQFIREQLAGDVLAPGDPEGIVATGFIAAGPWDFVGHTELREGTMEKARVRSLDRDEMAMASISAFASLTVHCARCHDHKFDPIPQADYYRLQACFAGVDRGERAYEEKVFADFRAEMRARRAALEARRAQLARKGAGEDHPEVAALSARIEELEKRAERARKQSGGESPTNGYHSAIEPRADARKWVQIDLGEAMPLESIRLIPARPTDFADTPGFGFPARFRVEVSDEESFAAPSVLEDRTAEDFPNPGAQTHEIAAEGARARFIRVTAEKLWPRSGDYVFALAELEAISGGRNAAAGAKVTAADSIEAGRWSAAALADGFDSRAPLAAGSGDASAETEALAAELAKLNEEKKILSARLGDAAASAELESVAAALIAQEKWEKALPPEPRTYAAVPLAEPRPVHFLNRGNVDSPGELMHPGALSAVAALPAEFSIEGGAGEGAARAALAAWLSDERNPLAWRSIVNRVWQHHMGRGIVETPNDFGANGAAPTHPELLDWLAAEFLARGQSIKELHRLIVTSATYRQSSAGNAEAERADSGNRLLWRANRRRLSAEEIRDAALAVSGKLDLAMGGPSVELFAFKDDHSPHYDYRATDDPKTWRRTIYTLTVRSVPDPFLTALDCADPSVSAPVRGETLTALQALALLNDPFMLRQAGHFAARVEREEREPARRAAYAMRLAFAREPGEAEARDLAAYAEKHGLAAACRLLLNANEFVFVD